MQDKAKIDFPKIAIVGNGAIGGLIGFKCQQLHYDYQHLVKTPQHPIQVTDITGLSNCFPPPVSLITEPSQFDILILPVKAYQVLPVLRQLQPFIQPNHVIVLLHNGMGTIDQVTNLLPSNPLIAAITSYGAFKPDANTLIETGLGQTHLGWISHSDATLKHTIEPILAALLPPSQWHQDISMALWKKLAINAVINPLTALNNIKNGKLADSKYTDIIINICDEISKVMSALGYAVVTTELIENVQSVITATANNYSSMHQDIKFKRQTEIAFINGYIVTKATELNIEVPYNLRLLEQIGHLQSTH